MFPEIREFISSPVLALVLAFIFFALERSEIITVKLARYLLLGAWIIAVANAAASLNDAPLQHRAIAAAIIGIPFGFALIVLDRWMARNIKGREATALAPQAVGEKNLEPNIVCEGDADLFVTLGANKIFRRAEPKTAPLRVAAVKFTNEPKPPHKVASVVNNVRARIRFYDWDWHEKEDHRVDYGCWLNEASPYVSFNLTDKVVHYLIVAVFGLIKEGDGGYKPELTIYGNSPDKNMSIPEYANRFSWDYRVKVSLIVGEHGEFSREYDFELRGDPKTSYSFEYITEEEKQNRRTSFAHELERSFIVKGERFFVKPDETTDWGKYYSDAHEWRNGVYKYIKAHHGTSIARRFLDVPELKPFPHEIPDGRDRFLDELYTQFVNLKEMAKEYGFVQSRFQETQENHAAIPAEKVEEQKAKGAKSAPGIERKGTRAIKLPLDPETQRIISSKYKGEKNSLVAYLAKFYYVPEPNTPDWVYVTAHISFYDGHHGNTLLYEALRPVWFETESNKQLFKRAEVHELIIVIGSEQLASYESSDREGLFHYGGVFQYEFRAEVELIIERDQDVARKTFNYQLIGRSKSNRLITLKEV
jgi:hypothetical protein